MRIGAFEIEEHLPDMRDPHVVTVLVPWLDAGKVGALALNQLRDYFGARELGKLAVPGRFFDFTRYRPTVHYVDGERVLTMPNTTISYARPDEGPDLLFLHMLEPHAFAETYIQSVLRLLTSLGIKRHVRLGASYGSVPHTRTLPVSYSLNGQRIDLRTGEPIPQQGFYEGPTSIMNSVTNGMEESGIETMSLMVRLPYYAQLEEDYTGKARLLETFADIYSVPSLFADIIAKDKSRGERQYRRISAELVNNPAAKSLVEQLESDYDAQPSQSSIPDTLPPLSPDIEKFLREMDDQLGNSQ